MITAEDILGLRTASRDYQKTQTLKTNLAQALRNRAPWYLTIRERDQKHEISASEPIHHHSNSSVSNKNIWMG